MNNYDEMNRTLTSTIGKYLKGDDLKLAQQKYRAFKSLAKAISEELGVHETNGVRCYATLIMNGSRSMLKIGGELIRAIALHKSLCLTCLG